MIGYLPKPLPSSDDDEGDAISYSYEIKIVTNVTMSARFTECRRDVEKFFWAGEGEWKAEVVMSAEMPL